MDERASQKMAEPRHRSKKKCWNAFGVAYDLLCLDRLPPFEVGPLLDELTAMSCLPQ